MRRFLRHSINAICRSHAWCRARFPLYAAWDEHPYSSHTHWIIFGAFFVGWLAAIATIVITMLLVPLERRVLALAGQNVTQAHYRWRNDDGNEATATFAAAEDTSVALTKDTTTRLRLGISNEGTATADPASFRLQYAPKGAGTCATVAEGSWVTVPSSTTASQHFQLSDSANLTDAGATTNVASGLTDENTTFVAGATHDTTIDPANSTLTNSQFTEMEYGLKATTNATDGGNYCMRTVNAAGVPVRTGALTFADEEENLLYSAVIDAANGFAYFGTHTSPGKIVKVQLSNLTRVGALTLAAGEDFLRSATIDAAAGFAYFGTNTIPGKIIKIRLSDFTRVGALPLQTGENQPTSAVIDPANGFAYFGTGTSPGRIVKIRLSDFTRVDARELDPGENNLYSAVIDTGSGFAYFGTLTSPGVVVKVNIAPSGFARVSAKPLEPGENNLTSAVIDTGSGFAYFGTLTSPGIIVKIRLSNFTRDNALPLPAGVGEDNLRSAVIDSTNTFAYFGTGNRRVVKVRLSNFTRENALTLAEVEDDLFSAIFDAANGFAYFGVATSPGIVVKIQLSDFTRVGALTLGTLASNFFSAVLDSANGFAYFGTNTAPGKIVKIRLSDFTQVGMLTLSEEDDLRSAVIDTVSGFAYFGTSASPGKIVKIRLSDFTRVGALTLNSGENNLISAVIDTTNGFAYFGTYGFPGNIVKVNIAPSGFARVSAIPLNSGENSLYSAVLDSANGFAYFGTDTSPSIIVKIRLSNFTRNNALPLAAGEEYTTSATLDAANGFAYFGTATSPGKIVKIQLSDFTRVGALTLAAGENYLGSATLDAANGFAYFGTGTSPGIVVKVRLSDFTRVGALTLAAGESNLDSAVIDTSSGFAYFGTGTSPGIVAKVDVRNLLDTYTVYAQAVVPSANTAPASSTPASYAQATDGTGRFTFQTTVSDADANATKLLVEVKDSTGAYTTVAASRLTLVSATNSSGITIATEGSGYHIQGIPTAAANTLTIRVDTTGITNLDGSRLTNFQFRVTPHDGTIAGATQTSSSVTYDDTAPSGLAALAAGTATTTAIPLTWTSATDASFDHYEIWYGTVQSDVVNRTGTASEWDNSPNDAALATATTTTTTVTGLTSNTNYYFKIFAVDTFGNEATIASIAASTDSPPIGLAALAAGTATTTTLPLTWTSATDASFDHYEIWYGTVQSDVTNRTGTASEWDNTPNDAALATATTTTTTITSLTSNTNYYFKIFAVDTFGNEATIASITASTLAPSNITLAMDTAPPSVPSAFSATATDDGKVLLTWTDPPESDLESLIILRSLGAFPVSGTSYATLAKGVGRFLDASVTAGETYNYILKASDTAGNFSLTSVKTIAIPARVVSLTRPDVNLRRLMLTYHPDTTLREERKAICDPALGAALCSADAYFSAKRPSALAAAPTIATPPPSEYRIFATLRDILAQIKTLTTTSVPAPTATKRVVRRIGKIYNLTDQTLAPTALLRAPVEITLTYTPAVTRLLLKTGQTLALARRDSATNTWYIVDGATTHNATDGSFSVTTAVQGNYALVIVQE